ncbi:MAG: serine/threonine-protein kinase [Panacagrimonas sp.]
MHGAPDTRLSHYRFVTQIGTGGMADVYEALDERLGRRVALKVLPPEFGRDPKAVQRFEKEVRAAASLNHNGIVSVFGVGQDQGVHFFSMRLLTGGDLRTRMERVLDAATALGILREVADAFSHAHLQGFVHRDVKPENIMFDEQGHPVLTDFGIAKALASGARLTATGTSIGTPRYISPEQARGHDVDLYSLGVILFAMLAGHPPYDGEDSFALIFKHVSEPIPKLPPTHAALQPLIDALMAKEPGKRPDSAAALIRLIDGYVPGNRTASLVPAAAPQSTPSSSQVVTLVPEHRPPKQLRARSDPMLDTEITLLPASPAAPVSPVPAASPAAAVPGPQETPIPARSAPVSARTKWPVRIFAVMAVAALVFLAFVVRNGVVPQQEAPATAESPASAPPVTPVEPPTPVLPAGPTQTEQIAALLSAAIADRDAGRVTEPADDNAAEKYQAVLRLDPDRAEALRGSWNSPKTCASPPARPYRQGNWTLRRKRSGNWRRFNRKSAPNCNGSWTLGGPVSNAPRNRSPPGRSRKSSPSPPPIPRKKEARTTHPQVLPPPAFDANART